MTWWQLLVLGIACLALAVKAGALAFLLWHMRPVRIGRFTAVMADHWDVWQAERRRTDGAAGRGAGGRDA